jgi:hypothetical protein
MWSYACPTWLSDIAITVIFGITANHTMLIKKILSNGLVKANNSNMMTINDFCELFGECQFKVGDMAYYRSPESKYSVRKANVCGVEQKERRMDWLLGPYYVLTLENGIIQPSSEAFVTRQEAEACFVEELKTQLTLQQMELDNLQQEMAYEAAVLERLERRRKAIETD